MPTPPTNVANIMSTHSNNVSTIMSTPPTNVANIMSTPPTNVANIMSIHSTSVANIMSTPPTNVANIMSIHSTSVANILPTPNQPQKNGQEIGTGFSHLEWSSSVPFNVAEEPDDVQGKGSEFMGKTFQAAQLTHERFLTIDHSCKIFF